MNKNLIIGLIVVAVIVVVGFLLVKSSGQSGTIDIEETQPTQTETTSPPTETKPETTTKESEPVTISMSAGNFFFSPKSISAKVGQPITVNISNSGSHTFTIDALGVNTRLSAASETVTFTPSKSGSFEYYCAVPGHRENGMLGTLSVE